MRKVAPEKRNSTAKTYLVSTELDQKINAHLERLGVSQSTWIRQLVEREINRSEAAE